MEIQPLDYTGIPQNYLRVGFITPILNCVAEKIVGEMAGPLKNEGIWCIMNLEATTRQITASFPDVIVYLRCGTLVPTEPNLLANVDAYIAYFRSLEIPVFYYLDDAIFQVNNFAPFKIMQNCDEVIVATQALVDYLVAKEYNKPIHLLKTHMDIPMFDLFPPSAAVMDKDKLNILFTSEGRIGTLMLDRICERMSQTPEKYKGVRLVCITSGVAQLRTIINKWRGIEKVYYERIPLVEYYGIFKMSDIILAPGEPGDLNYFLPVEEQEIWLAAKSCVKYTIAGASYLPCIASPWLKEYKMAIKHGETGYIAETVDDWIYYIDLLIEDEAKRKEIGANARKDVEQNWHIYKRVEQFAKILKGQSECRVK